MQVGGGQVAPEDLLCSGAVIPKGGQNGSAHGGDQISVVGVMGA